MIRLPRTGKISPAHSFATAFPISFSDRRATAAQTLSMNAITARIADTTYRNVM
ncbi:MAG: hypothetical protein K6G66_11440 [Oscillospiraceae bacterium]|nr:hypothetical protein [Oscillospiraceae bacterium]